MLSEVKVLKYHIDAMLPSSSQGSKALGKELPLRIDLTTHLEVSPNSELPRWNMVEYFPHRKSYDDSSHNFYVQISRFGQNTTPGASGAASTLVTCNILRWNRLQHPSCGKTSLCNASDATLPQPRKAKSAAKAASPQPRSTTGPLENCTPVTGMEKTLIRLLLGRCCWMKSAVRTQTSLPGPAMPSSSKWCKAHFAKVSHQLDNTLETETWHEKKPEPVEIC